MDYQAHEQAGSQEGEKPEPQPDLSAVAKEAMEEYALDVAADKHNRDGGFEDIQFAIGNQWDAAARAERERVAFETTAAVQTIDAATTAAVNGLPAPAPGEFVPSLAGPTAADTTAAGA